MEVSSPCWSTKAAPLRPTSTAVVCGSRKSPASQPALPAPHGGSQLRPASRVTNTPAGNMADEAPRAQPCLSPWNRICRSAGSRSLVSCCQCTPPSWVHNTTPELVWGVRMGAPAGSPAQLWVDERDRRQRALDPGVLEIPVNAAVVGMPDGAAVSHGPPVLRIDETSVAQPCVGEVGTCGSRIERRPGWEFGSRNVGIRGRVFRIPSRQLRTGGLGEQKQYHCGTNHRLFSPSCPDSSRKRPKAPDRSFPGWFLGYNFEGLAPARVVIQYNRFMMIQGCRRWLAPQCRTTTRRSTAGPASRGTRITRCARSAIRQL